VTLSGLTSSEHFVTVIAPGYTLTQGKARGEASFTLQPVPAAKRLKALEERIADDPDGLERDTALRELGLLAGAQQVVALMVRGSPGVAGAQGATAVRIDASDGHNLAYATAPVPLAGEAMDAGIQSLVASVLKADAPRVEGKPGHIPALKVSSGRKTAGYVLLATGAALLVGGVYFGLSASSKASDFKNTPQRSAQAETLKSDGQRFALIADIGFIAGLASAGAGSWLAFARGGGGETAEQASSRPAPAPARPVTPPPSREPTPVARPAEKPVAPAPAPQSKPSANTRAEEERRAREEAAKREEEDKRKREEAARREEEDKRRREEEARKKQGEAEAAKRAEEAKRQEAAKRAEEAKRQEEAKRAEEEKRKREEEERKKQEEEKRKREEEAKKKKPALDDDDLRNY
jgi:hypothetical protein